MEETSKVLLDQPPKPSLLEGLLVNKKNSSPRTRRAKNSSVSDEKGRNFTKELPKSQVLGKVKDFLQVMAEANEKLQINAQGNSCANYDIEVLNGNEQEYIEMDLLLGVADLHTAEAVAAAEATIGRVRPSMSSGSSFSDTEDESDEDSGSENGNPSMCHPKKRDSDKKQMLHGDKPKKRPKIIMLD